MCEAAARVWVVVAVCWHQRTQPLAHARPGPMAGGVCLNRERTRDFVSAPQARVRFAAGRRCHADEQTCESLVTHTPQKLALQRAHHSTQPKSNAQHCTTHLLGDLLGVRQNGALGGRRRGFSHLCVFLRVRVRELESLGADANVQDRHLQQLSVARHRHVAPAAPGGCWFDVAISLFCRVGAAQAGS